MAYIYRIAPVNYKEDYKYQYNSLFINDADIKIKNRLSEEFCLSPVTDTIFGNHYTTVQPFSGEPLTDYFLTVNYNGRSTTGKTTSPGDFEIMYPKSGQILNYRYQKNIDIKWSRSKNAKGYLVSVYIPNDYFSYEWFSKGYGTIDVGTDTSYKYNIWVFGDLPDDSCAIRVFAYDNNYFQHYKNLKESAGLNDAYGCFSSSVMKEIKVLFIK